MWIMLQKPRFKSGHKMMGGSGLGKKGQMVAGLPKSFSTNATSSRSYCNYDEKEDLRELIRADSISNNNNMKVDMNMNLFMKIMIMNSK